MCINDECVNGALCVYYSLFSALLCVVALHVFLCSNWNKKKWICILWKFRNLKTDFDHWKTKNAFFSVVVFCTLKSSCIYFEIHLTNNVWLRCTALHTISIVCLYTELVERKNENENVRILFLFFPSLLHDLTCALCLRQQKIWTVPPDERTNACGVLLVNKIYVRSTSVFEMRFSLSEHFLRKLLFPSDSILDFYCFAPFKQSVINQLCMPLCMLFCTTECKSEWNGKCLFVECVFVKFWLKYHSFCWIISGIQRKQKNSISKLEFGFVNSVYFSKKCRSQSALAQTKGGIFLSFFILCVQIIFF